jgi:methionyl-tRNA synthetase
MAHEEGEPGRASAAAILADAGIRRHTDPGPLGRCPMPRTILVTTALPYANGPLHLGHILEGVLADVWVRYQRMQGADCLFFCADDAHGTAVMLKARELRISPEALIDEVRREHMRDFLAFGVTFDHYHTTHSEENRRLVETCYERLRDGGYLRRRSIVQNYDEDLDLFLPDRYIRGRCPRCGAEGQYGDSCEVCGASYDATELRDPVSVLTGRPPGRRASEHLFVDLDSLAAPLRAFVHGGSVPEAVAHKLDEWLAGRLNDWDITRDAPYFGFPVPGETDKYFYVWLDAPLGYLATLRSWAGPERADEVFERYWGRNSNAEIHHVIGKDIIYFHALFWPALLTVAGWRLPTRLSTHGFLNVGGFKMSKSRGTFVTARDAAASLEPEAFRYYFASRAREGIDDLDLDPDELAARFNGDLVGKIVNIAARSVPFLVTEDGLPRTASACAAPDLYGRALAAGGEVADAYEKRDFARAVRTILTVADEANAFIAQSQPWLLRRDPDRHGQASEIATLGIGVYRLLALYLAPVLPKLRERSEAFLGVPLDRWSSPPPLLDHRLNPYTPLLERLPRQAAPGLFVNGRNTRG